MLGKEGKSVGQRLDEVLEPFLADRARLRAQLKDLKKQQELIETRLRDTQRDLNVVDQSMLQALRETAKQDPLLTAAFSLSPAEAATAANGNGRVATTSLPRNDLNPLLNPVGAENA